MLVFGVGNVYRFWTPKGGPPQYYSEMRYTAPNRCHLSVLYLIRAETAFALPYMPDGGMQP